MHARVGEKRRENDKEESTIAVNADQDIIIKECNVLEHGG